MQRIGTVERATGALERHGRLVGRRAPLTFRYPGASYVKLHFSRVLLRPGDRLVVADPAGRESHTYTGGELADGWAMSITGDAAVVRLEQGTYDPMGMRTRLAGLGVTVDKVARGFTDAEAGPAGGRPAAPGRPGAERAESVCGRTDDKHDAVCYRSSHPVRYERSKAVARMLINGVELCTAFRVGPFNRMLTNNHCVASTYDVRGSELWFNYECAVCGGWPEDTPRTAKVWGAELVASDPILDFALFRVHDFATIDRFGYLELDPRRLDRGEELYIPQHPRGLPTMIAMDDPEERGGHCAVDNPTYHGYDVDTDVSYFCDTEGGSSGSPVLAAGTNRVVALHHFGGCPNSGVRVDLIHRQIGQLI